LREEIVIDVQGLTKRYGRTVAVNDLHFSVKKGEILGFLGPNGAGKTTTMRVLTCFMPPTTGKVTVAGFDVMKEPLEVKKRVGYLPETPPLYTDMRVDEMLIFAGRIKGVSGSDLRRRVAEVSEKTWISDVSHKIVGHLSKGYRQRVGLAAALIHNPEVLVLDEPTAGLDPKQIIETRELIHNLAGEHTIILSTHILSEVEHSCDRVVIINKGKLVATDSVANLTSRLRGSELVAVEIESNGGALSQNDVHQRLEQVSGVSRVLSKDTRDGRYLFEIESLQGRQIRPELAKAVVAAGWGLTELHAVGLSLEEIFLQLTAAEKSDKNAAEPAAKGSK
jgi:ABC-2 type transport system ATP-binding protein